MEQLFELIEKRKSMRKYDENLTVSTEEMARLEAYLKELAVLNDERVAFRIVARRATTAKWGEYCLLAYSEKQEPAWLNMGYLMEQVDLFLASMDVGACWYGMSRPDQKQHNGLDYGIMLAFGKCRPGDFRQSPAKIKRKEAAEIWTGDFDPDLVKLAGYAPSACNAQPWRVIRAGNTLKIYRTTAYRSIIPPFKKAFLNSIDLGIFLCFLELVLGHYGDGFTRTLSIGAKSDDKKLIPIAEYVINA